MGAVVECYPPLRTAVLSLDTLSLGFCFCPTDEELIDYYLRSKINENDDEVWVIREIDVCKLELWDLPGESKPRGRRNKKNKGGENVGVAKKRKLSVEQVSLLEKHFGNERKLDSERKDRLALELDLDPRQLAVWFQNRRSRWKNQKLEQEYSNLKNAHETTMLQKCHLETKVLKLEEELLEAKKEIQRLLEHGDKAPSNSSSSSQSQSRSMEVVNSSFLGEFRVEEYDDGDEFYIPENHYINWMEWISMYM